MKNFTPLIFFCSCILVLALSDSALAQKGEFDGLEKAMSAEQQEAAGLQKLSPEERAQLDVYIRKMVSKKTEAAAEAAAETAATEAVDQAIKERKVKREAPPVISSTIVGPFSGYSGNTTFTLANGQVWAQSQRNVRPFPKVDSPPVLIVKGKIGYRMYIAGGGDLRVQRIR